ncbi:MAG: SapC family protein [Caulobacteraceae bacterium]
MTDTVNPHQAELTGEALFYVAPEPLSKEAHAGLGIKNLENPYAFTARTHLVPLTVTEFGPAALCYPIIFIGAEKTPVAVMGVNADENLYVDERGAYAQDAYLPAYVRRYPFVLANDAAAQRMVVCIDTKAPMISNAPDAPFFENGEPSAFTKGAIDFCNNFEQEAQRTLSFVNLLKELDLFEEKTATYTPPGADGQPTTPQTIAVYQGVSEAKLNALPADKLKELSTNGALSQVYAHLISLFGWDRLIVKAMLRPRIPVAANN